MTKNIIIGALILISGYSLVSAYNNPMQIVDVLNIGAMVDIRKMYDSNNGVTCYIYRAHGISCVK